MFKKLITVLSLMLVCCSSAYCESQEFIYRQVEMLQNNFDSLVIDDSSEDARARKQVLLSNVEFLENIIRSKIHKQQKSLDKLRERIDSIDGPGAGRLLKKYSSKEKKIYQLNEILFTVEMLKVKMSH